MNYLDVPVIDFSNAYSENVNERSKLAEEIGNVVTNIGFLVLSNHGVNLDVVKKAQQQVSAFFSLPTDKKKEFSPKSKSYYRGYFGMETGNLGATLGDKEALPDLREYFTLNRELGPACDDYFKTGLAQEIFIPNIWPDNTLPEFKKALLEYYREMEALAERIMRMFALSLGVDEFWFSSKIDKHMTNLVAANYPEQKNSYSPSQIRAGSHTDYGSLTILKAENKPGLQVKNKLGEWKDVPIVDNSFIVNLGDLMSYWTGGKWVSNIHRVINPKTKDSNSDRQSIVFFHQPNFDAVIETIPGLEKSSKYPTTTAYEHLMSKINKMNKTSKFNEIGE